MRNQTETKSARCVSRLVWSVQQHMYFRSSRTTNGVLVGGYLWAEITWRLRDELEDRIKTQTTDLIADCVKKQPIRTALYEIPQNVTAQIWYMKLQALIGTSVRRHIWTEVTKRLRDEVEDRVWIRINDPLLDWITEQSSGDNDV